MSERLFLRLEDDAVHGPEANVPADTLHACPVSPPLRGHVAHILLYRERMARDTEVLERVLPDGAVRLVFNLGDAPSVQGRESHAVEAVGASVASVVVRLSQAMEGLSVTLRPGAAAALLGLPAGEIADRTVPLDALWGGEADDLLQRLRRAANDTARVALLSASLEHRLRRSTLAAHQGAAQAARLIAAGGGRRPLRDVAEAVGVGERRLQQLFQTHVGLSPRAWSRLARLHGCVRALRRSTRPAWADMAVDNGFYDQPHLVNEFRAMCGITPTEFLQFAAKQ